jgi:hypothetical protein
MKSRSTQGWNQVPHSHIRGNQGLETVELTFLIPRACDQQLCVMAKVGELSGSKPERHASPACAAAIRCRKLGS